MRMAIALLMVALVLGGCAQVPKESVELSTTVGRDLGELHTAHRQSVMLLYERMERDVNEFVDEIYTPYQINKTLKQHGETLEVVISEALASDATPDDQEQARQFLAVYVEELHQSIEDFRSDTLAPLHEQEQALLTEIDEAYRRVHDANAVVTAHLASVVKVHWAQAEALESVDLSELRERISRRTGDISRKIGGLVEKARRGEEKVDQLADQLKGLVGSNHE